MEDVKPTDTIVEETSTSTTSPEETADDSTKEKKEVTTDEVTPKSTKEELFDEIDAVEGDERGKFSLKVGDSTYWGKTKKEVIQNLVKGKEDQDNYIRKVKATEKVKTPQPKAEDDIAEVKIPTEREVYAKHIETVTKRYPDVTIDMLRFNRDDWNRYQDEKGLRDHEISDLKRDKERILNEADELTKGDMRIANVAYINKYTIEKETSIVREMIAESGIDIDKFDADEMYEAAFKKCGKAGELEPGMITGEAFKQITKIMRQGTPVKKDFLKEIEKAKEVKKDIKTPTNGTKITKDDNGKTLTYDQLAREEKKAIGRAGRDI